MVGKAIESSEDEGIEGNPFIIRFKTEEYYE